MRKMNGITDGRCKITTDGRCNRYIATDGGYDGSKLFQTDGIVYVYIKNICIIDIYNRYITNGGYDGSKLFRTDGVVYVYSIKKKNIYIYIYI